MQTQTINREHTFNRMREYMFYGDNLCKWTRFMEVYENKRKTKKVKKSQFVPKSKEYFSPRQKDKLFWCFYIIVNGMENYNFAQNNIFSVEKDFKFATIDLFRKKKNEMKALKMKLVDIEDNLINARYINVSTLQALCFVYEKSIIYKQENMYYDFSFGDKYTLLEYNEKGVEMHVNAKDDDIQSIKEKYYYLDVKKPIRGISVYNIIDIQTISTKIGIKLKDDNGKTKIKKALYQEIVQMIEKLR